MIVHIFAFAVAAMKLRPCIGFTPAFGFLEDTLLRTTMTVNDEMTYFIDDHPRVFPMYVFSLK